MGPDGTARQQRGALLALAITSIIVVLVLLNRSTGNDGPESSVSRDVASEDRGHSSADLVAARASRTGGHSREQVAEAGVEAQRPEMMVVAAQPERRLPKTLTFAVQTVDKQGIPVPGVGASVQVIWSQQGTNPVLVLAPDLGPRTSFGLGQPYSRPGAGPRQVIFRTEKPGLVGDGNGKMIVEVPDVPHDPQLVTALFQFSVTTDSSIATPADVVVSADQTRQVIVTRGGSLEVHLAPLAGGVIPHVGPGVDPGVGGTSRTDHHHDVRLTLRRMSDRQRVRGHSTGVDSFRWDHLVPGVYEISAFTAGLISQRPLALLQHLDVRDGGACDDARLAGWDPFAGNEVMFVTVEGPRGGSPQDLTIGYISGPDPPTWNSMGVTARYDGRVLPIVGGTSFEARVYFEAPGSRRTTIGVTPGARHVTLQSGIELELTLVWPPGMATDVAPLRAQVVRIADDGTEHVAFTTKSLTGDSGRVSCALTTPGRYMVRPVPPRVRAIDDREDLGDVPPPRFQSVPFDVEDAPVVRLVIELRESR